MFFLKRITHESLFRGKKNERVRGTAWKKGFMGKPELVLFLSLLGSVAQIAWFWRFCAKNINFDAISYIGIARHIVDGNVRASLNGFWSPLFSWFIFLGAFLSSDYTLVARIFTMASFFLCSFLLYIFTKSLWNSSLDASLTVLWFFFAHGLTAISISFIGADFLFSACVLVYFILLWHCIKKNDYGNWLFLGLAHVFSFLAKAFAFPWLTLVTLFSVLIINRHQLRKGMICLLLALLIPSLGWVSWGMILKGKYGVFPGGYQFKRVLFLHTLQISPKSDDRLRVLKEASKLYDPYLVLDPFPPHSEAWRQKIPLEALLPKVIFKIKENVSRGLKQMGLLITPGGILSFLLGMSLCLRRGETVAKEAKCMMIILFGSVTLILLYSPLVLEGRYLIPFVPLWIAGSMKFLFPLENREGLVLPPKVRKTLLVITILTIIFSMAYWASPFKRINRDFQVSCYSAAQAISQLAEGKKEMVIIGEGPFPDRGVGWEAGFYAAYFSQAKIVGYSSFQKEKGFPEKVLMDLEELKPRILLVWGTPQERTYLNLIARLKRKYSSHLSFVITDPEKGEVATVFGLNFS